mmetsp:Transcript_22096/g.54673  ORF Transcript_22096/g.54673 Transcript_22096/m.54673 type:complete len:347 (+) Transcript_22096:976-2016(+)
MNSENRGSRIFHRYHQQQRQSEDRARKVDGNGVLVTPTRRRAYPTSTKSTSSRTITTTSNVVDDLTLGYNPSPGQRSATERNPKEYEASPASSKSFRIVSLDGCYEEQVSPLLTDSSSSISSNKIRNVPMIPAPPRCVTTKREINVNRRKKKAAHNSMPTVSTNIVSSRQEEVAKPTPPSDNTTRRRRSAHARSHFVFDGNLCFGAVSSPPPMYLPTSPMLAYPSPAYPCTPKASFPGAMGMNYPPMATPMSMSPRTTPMMPLPAAPMAHMSPPPTAAFSSGSNHREQQQEIQKQGRKTPPPTPKEQRRRNRAMPSLQYEDLVFNQLRQEQLEEYEKEQLQRQNTW